MRMAPTNSQLRFYKWDVEKTSVLSFVLLAIVQEVFTLYAGRKPQRFVNGQNFITKNMKILRKRIISWGHTGMTTIIIFCFSSFYLSITTLPTMEILLVIEDKWIMMENIISLPHSSMSTRNWKDERGQTCSRSIGNLLWRLEDVVISFYSLFQWNKASDRKINLFFPQKLRQTALLWVHKCHIRYYYKRNLPHVI